MVVSPPSATRALWTVDRRDEYEGVYQEKMQMMNVQHCNYVNSA